MLRELVKNSGSQQATAAVLRTMSPVQVAHSYYDEYYLPAKRELDDALIRYIDRLDEPRVQRYISGLKAHESSCFVTLMTFVRTKRFV